MPTLKEIKKRDTYKRRAALYKGLFIDNFLLIERQLEEIILTYFQESFYPLQIPESDLTRKIQELELSRINNTKNFFEHFLFIQPSFGFKIKFESVKTILQLLDGTEYEKLTKNKSHNLFTLVEHLNSLRNIIAHNETDYVKSQGLVGFKKMRPIKTAIVDSDDINEPSYLYIPKINEVILSSKLQKQIDEQLNFCIIFLGMYCRNNFALNRGHLSPERISIKEHLIGDYLSKQRVFSKDYGVFKLLK